MTVCQREINSLAVRHLQRQTGKTSIEACLTDTLGKTLLDLLKTASWDVKQVARVPLPVESLTGAFGILPFNAKVGQAVCRLHHLVGRSSVFHQWRPIVTPELEQPRVDDDQRT